jgi:chromosome segregation ATPase
MTEKSKVKKKKSLSAQIRDLRIQIKSWEEDYNEINRRRYLLENRIQHLQKLIPIKFYRIEYEIRNNEKRINKNSEICESYTLQLAIEELKIDKTYPGTFKLIDVKVLG